MFRLQRYLLRELLTAFVLVLLIITGIFLAGSLLQMLQKFPELSLLTLLEAVPLFLALSLPVTVPLSFLMACLLSYGRFADDNEFLAMQMGGINPWNAVAPAICAAAFVSFGTLWINTDLNPTLTSAKKEVLRGQIREGVERMHRPGVTHVRWGDDMEMSWGDRDGDGFLQVLLTWTTSEKDPKTGAKVPMTHRAWARRATVRMTADPPPRLVITLEDARIPAEDGSGGTTFVARSVPIVYDPGEETSLTWDKGRDEMRASELYYHIERLSKTLGADRRSDEWHSYFKFTGEYWRRIALGMSPFAFALLGAPLGLVVKRGSRTTALVIALLVALPVYYPLLLIGDDLASKGALPPALALNLGNLVLAVTGVVLVARLVAGLSGTGLAGRRAAR